MPGPVRYGAPWDCPRCGRHNEGREFCGACRAQRPAGAPSPTVETAAGEPPPPRRPAAPRAPRGRAHPQPARVVAAVVIGGLVAFAAVRVFGDDDGDGATSADRLLAQEAVVQRGDLEGEWSEDTNPGEGGESPEEVPAAFQDCLRAQGPVEGGADAESSFTDRQYGAVYSAAVAVADPAGAAAAFGVIGAAAFTECIGDGIERAAATSETAAGLTLRLEPAPAPEGVDQAAAHRLVGTIPPPEGEVPVDFVADVVVFRHGRVVSLLLFGNVGGPLPAVDQLTSRVVGRVVQPAAG